MPSGESSRNWALAAWIGIILLFAPMAGCLPLP